MTDEQLQALVIQISQQFFKRPFLHQARFNHRLRTTGGRYLLQSHDIEINPKQYKVHGLEELIGIIKHELCHYHLHLQNKGYRHRDQDFKKLLKKVGGSRHCKTIDGMRTEETVKYSYRCERCQQLYLRKRKIDLQKYVCGKCSGRLVATNLKNELQQL
ncbi:SprT family protein [Pueribacillus sp. YX66]|uniref:SprT family protein n=1 Tax=Pueribacillus sp. YX66 TaxID=3229242 RepID=UPI00358D9D34